VGGHTSEFSQLLQGKRNLSLEERRNHERRGEKKIPKRRQNTVLQDRRHETARSGLPPLTEAT